MLDITDINKIYFMMNKTLAYKIKKRYILRY
jgi:hypothetical protein